MNNITRNLSRFGILFLVSFAAMAQRPWPQMTAPTVREAACVARGSRAVRRQPSDPGRSCGARRRPVRRTTRPARLRSGRGPDWGFRRHAWRCLHARRPWRMGPGPWRDYPVRFRQTCVSCREPAGSHYEPLSDQWTLTVNVADCRFGGSKDL
jgi:hypothetical protein